MLEAGRIALNGGIYCGDTRADVEAQHVAAIYTAMQAARPTPDLSNVEELVERANKSADRMHYWLDSAIGNRFECEESSQVIRALLDTITVLLDRSR
jgi:hypothetical protein